MNVVDSSGWIEYFTAGPNCNFFAAAIEDIRALVVPTLTLYEVFKWTARECGQTRALEAVAHMQLGAVVDLDARLTLHAAGLSLQSKLPMADSIVYATAQGSRSHSVDPGRGFRGFCRGKVRRQEKGREMNVEAPVQSRQ